MDVRYIKFEDMEHFHRFSVPEFYLQSLGNYINPLCVPCHMCILMYFGFHSLNPISL